MFGHGRTRVICVHAVAVAAAVAAIGVTLADPPALRVTPFAPFFIAAAVATVIGGFAPGLVAIGLGVLTALVWRIPPVPTLLVVPFIGLSVPAAWLISRYRELLRTVQESQARYAELFDQTSDLIYTHDASGRITSVNPAAARLTGFAPDSLCQLAIFDLVMPEERPRIRQIFETVMAGEAPPAQFYEVGLRRADGTAAIVEVTPQPVRRDGQIVAVHGIGRDITDRRRLESQARQSQKMQALGQLAAGVAHDVNNLLTGIMGYAELAVLGLDAVDTRRQPLTDLLRTAQRGAALTRQLLAFSRQQMLRPTLVDLNQTVRDLEDLLHRLLGERVVLRVTLADGVATVRLDPDQFSQVLINLVVNARDAMPGGGTLVLQTQEVTLSAPLVDPHFQIPAGSYALVSVSDTGAGMTREVLGHLFEPFFTTKPPGHGTGLGLATVYGIVRQSGGYIAVTSVPTQGSTFRLYFPRVDDLPTANTVRDRPQPAGAAPLGGTERILLVDDDHAVRTSAAGALRAAGYAVVAAESGEVALELVRDPANAVDLVLLDVVLPGLQGPDVLRALRARLPTVRALFISGDLDPATRVDAVFSRVPVLEKPFTARQLTRAVREVLDDEGARGNP